MGWQHAGLFPADFAIHTFVQIFLVIECMWTGVMGLVCTYNPAFAACLSETGVFKRISWTRPPALLSCKEKAVEPADSKVDTTGDAEEFVHPNIR